MSDIITTAQDAGREAAIRLRVAMHDLAERAKEQRGQTAAEYMGILLIISLIIAALFTAGVGEKIAGGVVRPRARHRRRALGRREHPAVAARAGRRAKAGPAAPERTTRSGAASRSGTGPTGPGPGPGRKLSPGPLVGRARAWHGARHDLPRVVDPIPAGAPSAARPPRSTWASCSSSP